MPSVLFVLIRRDLLSLHTAIVSTLCWCNPGSLQLSNREIKTASADILECNIPICQYNIHQYDGPQCKEWKAQLSFHNNHRNTGSFYRWWSSVYIHHLYSVSEKRGRLVNQIWTQLQLCRLWHPIITLFCIKGWRQNPKRAPFIFFGLVQVLQLDVSAWQPRLLFSTLFGCFPRQRNSMDI